MNLEIACTMASRLRGLIGRSGFNGVLLLVPCRDVHTFGMNRPIDVAFVASDGTIIESVRGVGPWRRLKNRHAAATAERFASESPWFRLGDRIQDGPGGGEQAQASQDQEKDGTGVAPVNRLQGRGAGYEKMPHLPIARV